MSEMLEINTTLTSLDLRCKEEQKKDGKRKKDMIHD